MKTEHSFVQACFLGLFLVGLPALVTSACSPEEKINPAPVDGGTSSSSGEGGAAGAASSSSGGQTGGMGGSGGSSGSGGSGGMGGMGGSSSSSSGQLCAVGGAGGGGMADMDGGLMDGSSSCVITTMEVPVLSAAHVANCSPVSYMTNPPTSGAHYGSWAAFKWYSIPVPRGFYVHSMEHGAVVISYNCPQGCADELASLQAFLDARPADPACVAPLKARIIVTPDPLLDTKFAASAWNAFYKGNCLDLPALGTFLDMYYAKAPENFCSDGIDPTNPMLCAPVGCEGAVDAGTD